MLTWAYVFPASRSEGERLPSLAYILASVLTGVFHSRSGFFFFPGLLPKGVTPITRKKMKRETSGCSRECAQLLEDERTEMRERRPGRRNHCIICPWKNSMCVRMEGLCAAYVYGAWSFPQRQRRQSSTTNRSSFIEVSRTLKVHHQTRSIEEG